MIYNKKGKKLDRKKGPREMMMRNLASSILMYEKVKTTEAKAKIVRPLVERMITMARTGSLTSRRTLLKVLLQKEAVKKALDVLGVRYKERNGGYTRIIKLGQRQGDGAEMVQIELV